jgi:hypothetical protein
MKPRAFFLPGLFLLSVGTITAGYLLEGIWMVIPALLGVSLLFFIARRRSEFQAGSVLLVGSFILASVGTMMKLSFALMLLGCIGALAGWDLFLFSQTVHSVENQENITLLERRHNQSLAIAISGGVLLSLMTANLTLELPFIVTLVLCAVALGGMYFGVRAFVRNDL